MKILDIDAEATIARLQALGADCLFKGRVLCLHFDDAAESLRAKGELFRLRRWVGEAGHEGYFEICYKGPKQIVEGCKVREEIETTVEDADRFESMMKAMGYHVTMDNEKRRRSYAWNGVRVDVDEYPQVPAYLEIEGRDRAEIDEAIRVLELGACEVSTETADELFSRKWPQVEFKRLKF